jgi:2-methylisocitrate lyase-like PEP mutase family enzyme
MNAFVEVLRDPGTVVIPSVHDALTARLAAAHGFPAATLAGYDLGTSLVVTEPLLTKTEVADACAQIKRTTDIALLVDIGAGFGEPVHAAQTARDLALIGVDAVQLEDQIYPKRVHYFKDYQEHIVSLDELKTKLEWVRRGGGDDLAVVARTDAYATDGEDEALRRVQALEAEGVDAIMAFPRTLEEARRLPQETSTPVIYVNTNGNRVGRPTISGPEAAELGYSLVLDVHTLLFAAFAAMDEAARRLAEDGVDGGDHIEVRRRVEQVLDVDGLLEIEAATVER